MVKLVDGPNCFYLTFAFNRFIFNYKRELMLIIRLTISKFLFEF